MAQKKNTKMAKVVSPKTIAGRIILFRGKKVMLDRDLAELYKVKPIALRQQVTRNKERFPADFMFQLRNKEAEFLVSQTVIPSKKSLGGHLPYAFTEQGVAMLSSVLNSERAIMVNIQIMRAFTKLKNMLSDHGDLKAKIESLGRKYRGHDKQFKIVFEAIRQLLEPPLKANKRIGF